MTAVYITAGTTRTQAGATAITEDVSVVNVSTAPAAGSLLGDGVLLPSVGSGAYRLILWNKTSNPIQVYGNGSDTVNGVAGSVGVTLPPNALELFISLGGNAWAYDAGIGTSGQLPTVISLDGIQAAGANQAGATALTADFNRITGGAGGVALPASAAGLDIIVCNHTNAAVQVYGNGADTVDDVAGATGVSQMASSVVLYTCYAPGAWYSEGLATGFASTLGLATVSNNQIAANVGGTQATGTPITQMLTTITSAGVGYSATLPVSSPGLVLVVHNISANAINVFPNAGGTGTEKINAGAANAALSMGANTSATFTCQVAGQWYTTPRTPS